jgi:hypothetical protein
MQDTRVKLQIVFGNYDYVSCGNYMMIIISMTLPL